jgi:hypothetical protein
MDMGLAVGGSDSDNQSPAPRKKSWFDSIFGDDDEEEQSKPANKPKPAASAPANNQPALAVPLE